MVNIFEKITNLKNWQKLLLAFAAGGLGNLALAPFHIMPIVFFTIPTFICLLNSPQNYKQDFFIGWSFGFGYFLGGLWWIANSLLIEMNIFLWLYPFAVLGIPSILAIYWALATMMTKLLSKNENEKVLAFALTFSLAEYLRANLFGGFAWNIFGATFAPNMIFMQIINILGIYGLTFFAFFIAAIPTLLIKKNMQKNISAKFMIVIASILFGGQILYGLLTIKNHGFEDINLKIIQPNIKQQDKLNPQKTQEIIETYIKLSQSNIENIDYIIWPESAFPFLLQHNDETLLKLDNLLNNNTKLITGAVRNQQFPYEIFNSIFVLNDKAEIIAISDKEKLVPFGEFLPFRNFLENIGMRNITQKHGDFSSGKRKIIQIKNDPPFLPLICYEIIFPSQNDNEKSKWIVNLTNDAWFGNSTGPYQHAHQSILRGVEMGMPVVRVANTGISFISDANGRIIEKIALNKQQKLTAKLPKAKKSTIYSKFNDIIFYIIACIVFIILIKYRIKQQTNIGKK